MNPLISDLDHRSRRLRRRLRRSPRGVADHDAIFVIPPKLVGVDMVDKVTGVAPLISIGKTLCENVCTHAFRILLVQNEGRLLEPLVQPVHTK